MYFFLMKKKCVGDEAQKEWSGPPIPLLHRRKVYVKEGDEVNNSESPS